MGRIVSKREAALTGLAFIFIAAIFICIPLQPTGRLTDLDERALPDGNTGGQEPESPQTSPSYDVAGICMRELSACENSVGELSGIVMEKCEKPYRDFELAAWEVAGEHAYSEDEFDCTDYSEALASRLGVLGYRARIAHGYYKGEPHAWVVAEIPIEATSGNIITSQQYADYAEKP